MSKRLQVLLPERELREIKRAAKRDSTTVAEWVRRVLRGALNETPNRSVESKLRAIREAAQHQFPIGDIDQVLAEIEQGYCSMPDDDR